MARQSSGSIPSTNSTLNSHQLGQSAEDQVATWLLQQGCQLVARNFRCRGGEIDLIVRQGKVLIFIEVRLRSSRGYASSLESITLQKQRRIIRCAQYFLLCHPQWNDYNTRFDVVALDKLSGEPDWVQSAFEYHGF